MARQDQVKQFFDQLYELCSTESDEIYAILLSLETGSDADFASLLTEYHDSVISFYPLLEHDRVDLLTDVFIYLITVNEAVLHQPLYLHEFPHETLLEILHIDDINHQGVLKWLKQNKPQVIEDFELRQRKTRELQEMAISLYTQKMYQEVIQLLANNPPLMIHKILVMNEAECLELLLEELIVAGEQSILRFLIDRDINVLKVDHLGQSLLASLCEEPTHYIKLLRYLDATHRHALDEFQVAKMNTAILAYSVEPDKSTSTTKSPVVESTSQVDADVSLSRPLISSSILNTYFLSDSTWCLHPELMPYINMELQLESIVLDAFIHQILFKPLMDQGILVMPVIQHSEPISLEQCLGLKMGTKLDVDFNVGIEVLNEQVEAVLAQKKCTKPQFVIWPINNSQLQHYGLFILDLTDPNAPISTRAFYIEPLKLGNQIRSFGPLDGAEDAFAKGRDVPFNPALLPCMYKRYIHHLNDQIQIDQAHIQYIHLHQSPGVNYCSDYILAVLMRLARQTLSLHDSTMLLALEGAYLSPLEVKAIRLIQMQRLGVDYFAVQLAPALIKSGREYVQRYRSVHAKNDAATMMSDSQVNSSSNLLIRPNTVMDRVINKFAHYSLFRNNNRPKAQPHSAQRQGAGVAAGLEQLHPAKHKNEIQDSLLETISVGEFFLNKRKKPLPASPLGRPENQFTRK